MNIYVIDIFKGIVSLYISVSDWTADVVDVVYVNTVTWSMECVGAGEAAKSKRVSVSDVLCLG
jgi:hypothetical protein